MSVADVPRTTSNRDWSEVRRTVAPRLCGSRDHSRPSMTMSESPQSQSEMIHSRRKPAANALAFTVVIDVPVYGRGPARL